MSSPTVVVRRPSARWRLGFFLLGLRLPAEHGPWVAEQVATSGQVRRVLGLRSLILVPSLGLWALVAWSPGLLGALVGALLGPQLWVERHRRHLLAHQGVDGLGRPVPLRGISRLSNTGMWLGTILVLALVLAVFSRVG